MRCGGVCNAEIDIVVWTDSDNSPGSIQETASRKFGSSLSWFNCVLLELDTNSPGELVLGPTLLIKLEAFSRSVGVMSLSCPVLVVVLSQRHLSSLFES
jgi:hypothetical protein